MFFNQVLWKIEWRCNWW